nr:zinc ABC transporter substrate-binding protein [Insulibacter thermoxylanivorax]
MRLSKKIARLKLTAIVVIASVLFAACSNAVGQGDSGRSEDVIRVVTTIAQIGEPLMVIGGDRVEVISLMGPGVDPHLYNASQGDIKKLQNADVVFYNGLNLEGNMTEVFEQIGKTRPVLAMAETIPAERLLTDEDGAVDPHIWFDIDLWQMALEEAVEELKKLSPDDAELFEENKQAYFAKLAELREEAAKLKSIPPDQRVLVTAHDAFGYFGRMHDMEVVGLQGLSTEDEIGLSDIQSIIELLVERQIPAVFVESTISEDTIRSVIDGATQRGTEVKLGGELFSDAMGEAGTEEGTYIGMYRHNVNTIYQALTRDE